MSIRDDQRAFCKGLRNTGLTSASQAADEIERLAEIIDRLLEVPADHRDHLLNDPPLRWSTARLETARDTCDVIRHKMMAEVAS